jgi:hypothetical protein
MAFPALRRVLGLTPMSPSDWALVGGAACIPAVVNEIRRYHRRGGPSAVSSPIQGEMHGSTQGNGKGPGQTDATR